MSSVIMGIALSANGSLLATAHKDGPISLWNAKTRQLRHRFEGHSRTPAIGPVFSPTDSILAASDSGGNIVLYCVVS